MTADTRPGSTDAPTGYPAAPRQDIAERLHGHLVADPYRWLEEAADPATERWCAAQDELARTQLDGLPGRAWLTERLTALLDTGSVAVPVWRAGRMFFTRREPGDQHPKLYVRPGSATEPRVLLDPLAIDPSGLTTLDAWAPSPEGTALAYQLSVGGDEESVLHVLDVDTGAALDEPIDRCRYSAMAWLPGGAELFLVRKVPPGEVPAGEEQLHRRIWRHRVGTSTARDVLLTAPGLYDGHTYYDVRVSRDGRWLVVTANVGTARRDSVWLADLSRPGSPPTRLLAQADGVQARVWVERDGRMYALTTDGAPRWRLCVVDPRRPEREHWRELVAEDPGSVLEGVRWLEPAPDPPGEPLLVLLRRRHAVAELALHRMDGRPQGTVPLPGVGAVTGLSVADEHTPEQRGRLWIGWTDPLTPPEVHRFELGSGTTTREVRAPGAPAEPPAARIEQVEFASWDGTGVRMFVVSPAGAEDDPAPRPALLTGYGGFAVTERPAYRPGALAWVDAGGVWALASLRGGEEEGEDWHRAGMREHKQRVFDDLHAAADHLVGSGRTSFDRLAIQGGSNGGLLVGAALTQRPAAYRAVVCSAPLLDMVRYERFLIGRTWNDEYGSAEVPEELGWLLSYSPYHRVVPGIAYPAVLFAVFDSDSRVDPAHARKMCAALQHATSGGRDGRPILLRRETDVGHGARSVSRSVALGVDQLAFLAAHTGLGLP